MSDPSDLMALRAAANRSAGLADPTLAYGLEGVFDWSVEMPFLDLMKMSRPLWGIAPGEWGGPERAELDARGLLDADGWPIEVPGDLDGYRTVFGWDGATEAAASRAGTYVLSFDGVGRISVGGIAQELGSGPGRVVFRIGAEPGNWWIDITETDPAGTGDHLRDVTIVRQDRLALFEAGAVFNPDWLAHVADARQVRFMDWMGTNDSAQSAWADRPEPGDVTWWGGVPVEIMVRLANEIGADPWFTIPHLAEDDYVLRFAIHVRDALDPRLKAHVEYGNELWNWQFGQTRWLLDASRALWDEDDISGMHLRQATHVAQLFAEVFGDERVRLVNVLSGQAANTWLTASLLEARVWEAHEPERALRPADIFDAFAVTSYFGNAVVEDAAMVAALRDAIDDPDRDAAAWLADRLRDPEVDSSIPQVAALLAEQKALAADAGLDLILYEGGQHVHHNGSHSDVDGFMKGFVRSPAMAALYAELWEVWAAHGDGPFMQFTDLGQASQYGAWGLRQALGDDDVPRAALLDRLNATAIRWWDDLRLDGSFGHGVVTTGSDAGDTLVGTAEEDRLLGGNGDDLLVGGAGDDGLHGGNGWDAVALSGTAALYTIRHAGNHSILSGPDGTDRLISIEELRFADGTVIAPDAIEEARRFERMPDLWGTAAGDTMAGSAGAERIAGGAGDDVIDGLGGADQILGGDGEDVLRGGAEADYLAGGDGADRLYGRSGDDVIEGGNGDDRLFGGAGADTMIGGAGDDLYAVDDAGDIVIEAAGEGDNDRIDATISMALPDHVEILAFRRDGAGFEGRGNAADNLIHGSVGADRIDAGAGNDRLFGHGGADTLLGGDGDDRYILTAPGAQIVETADGGRDAVASTVSHTLGDHVEDLFLLAEGGDIDGTGNALDNTLRGTPGANTLSGLDGDDRLLGGDGNDVLSGGPGDDTLSGGGGDDLVIGGAGADLLKGEAGADRFLFSAPGAADTIHDFTPGEDLAILVTAGYGVFSVDGALLALDTADVTAATRFVYDGLSGLLSFDADGSGDALSEAIAQFRGAPALTEGDVLLV